MFDFTLILDQTRKILIHQTEPGNIDRAGLSVPEFRTGHFYRTLTFV